MGGDATAGFQDVAGDGEFVGGCADISKRVMAQSARSCDFGQLKEQVENS